MIRTTSTAALFALALAAGAAHAETGNIVGGGGGALSGGGDDMAVTYSVGGAGGGSGVLTQSGRLARFAGSSDGTQLEYLAPAPAGPGREAWMVGGGDNAEVVYDRRR
jgi:hypothetical protein